MIPNFGIIHPNLFRSGQPTEDGWIDLDLLGVEYVVQLNLPEDVLPDSMVLLNRHIPTFTVDTNYVRDIVELIKSTMARGRVLVHCTHGRDRTGLVIGAYRILVDDWCLADVNSERADYGVNNWPVEIADFAIYEALKSLDAEHARKPEDNW